MRFNWACGSESRLVIRIRIQEGQNDLQKKKKSEEISCFDVVDDLSGELEASDGGTEILHKGL